MGVIPPFITDRGPPCISCLCISTKDSMSKYMRVEQKVHERGFLCVSLWVCNEQSRLKFFFELANDFFFQAKVLAKVHVHMSKLHCRYLYLVFIMYICIIL